VITFTNVTNNALINGIEVNTASSTPPTPTGLTATPGNTQIALSWNASSGATSYNVKRSTVSGSGYATVSSPTTTSYTNTGLTNGTTYYYVVSAVSSGGESANSSQVSAIPIDPNVHTGTWSLKLNEPTSTPAWSNMTEYPTVVANQTYVASLWIKGSGGVVLRIYNGSWGTVINTLTCNATSTWTQYSITGIATGSNTQLTYNLADGVAGPATCYIDDCFLGVANGTNTLTNAGFESGATTWEYTTGQNWTILQNP
jgi:hypothetical protein